MIIGIDARMYQEGLGIGRYIEKLIDQLGKVDEKNSYIVFLSKKKFEQFRLPNERWQKVCADYHWYSWQEQIFFPILLMRYRIDCMHFPHFNIPILYPRAFVATIHDLILMKFPLSAASAATTLSPLIHSMKLFAYRWIIRFATIRARAIITVSEYVKKDVCAYLCVRPEKIFVIYEAADQVKKCDSAAVLPATVRTPYIFSTGNAYPHKNIEGLLKAMVLLQDKNSDISLILCGQEDVFYRMMKKKIEEMGLFLSVQHLGFVSEEVLCALYTHSLAYIFPSFEEGFGLPALEAMAHDIPVIVSDTTCFQEILSDAAYYVNPHSPQSIADAITTIAGDMSLREQLRVKGLAQIKKYSWEQTARQTIQIYQGVMNMS